MALKHTLLGLLIFQPRSGYDLYKRIESAPFLLESATLRRIYPTLKTMTETGLTVFEVEPQEGKPDRKVYTITKKGQTEFLAWLRGPVEADDDTLQKTLSKVFFYGLLDKEILLTRLNEVRQERQTRLDTLQAITSIAPPIGPYGPLVDSDQVTAVWTMMIDYAQSLARTQVDWLKRMIQKIEAEF